MSDQFPPGAVPGGMPGGQQQPSEEELRAAIGQMRAAPVDQMIAEVASALINSVQVKLGRNDGRLLLDITGLLNEATRGYVDAELTKQLDDALDQLRMAQVQGEKEVVNAATEGHVEQNDLPRRPAPVELAERPAPQAGDEPATDDDAAAPGAPAGQQSQPSSGQGQASSRLWVPGR